MKFFLYILPLITLITFTGCGAESKVEKNTTNLSVKHSKKYIDSFKNMNKSWKQKEGNWSFTHGEVTQSITNKYFPLMLLEQEQYADVDVSVDFKPISGAIDASGGVVFRAKDAQNYYIVRANALEDNFRLYYFENGSRHEIASATVTPPTFKKFNNIRVVAKGEHIQAYLNGTLYIDHHDSLYSKGYVGLWTKADSVTVFDNFAVSGE